MDTTETPLRPLVRTGEMARLLDVDRATVNRWARAGRIPSVRVSTRIRRYDAGEVLRTLREGPPPC